MRQLAVHALLATLVCFGVGRADEVHGQTSLPVYEVVVRDGRFTPERLEVPAGRKIRINLRNEGPGPLEFENPDMHVEKVLGPDASSFVVLPKLEPGEYSFTDEFNPVTGNLIVVAK